jgi:hypothetical protein
MIEGRVQITTALGAEPRRLVPKGTNLSGTVLDPGMKPSGGVIKLPCRIATYIGRERTFGRSEKGGFDYSAVSPKHQSQRVLVPWIENFQVVHGRPVLNMVLFRADNIVRIAQLVAEGKATPADLQTSVSRYQDEIERTLCGKNGLFTRDLFGIRCKNSLRFVAVPNPDLEPDEIGLPEVAAHQAKIEDGNWILVGRAPELWQGSVLAMRAILMPSTAGHVPPYVMQGLGLDFDGDQMTAIRVPTELEPELRAAMEKSAGHPTLEHFKWAAEFLFNNPEVEPSWPAIKLDLEGRLAQNGLSLGPEDILDPEKSEFLGDMAARVEKIPPDTQQYANGMDIPEWSKSAEAAAVEVCRLKLEVGLLGAATDKANQVLLAFAPEALPAGMELKERLTDLMMKNAKKGGGTGYDTNLVTAMLDRRGPFKEASVETALDYMVKCGFDREKYRPMIECLYDMGGASTALRETMPLMQACRTQDRAALVDVLEGNWGYGSVAAKIHEYEEGADHEGLIPYSGIHSAGPADNPPRRSRRDELPGRGPKGSAERGPKASKADGRRVRDRGNDQGAGEGGKKGDGLPEDPEPGEGNLGPERGGDHPGAGPGCP